MTEFVECGGWSVSYDATGKATISASVITSSNNIGGSYETWNEGGVRFTGSVMSLKGSPMMGSGGWVQWSIGWQGVGC